MTLQNIISLPNNIFIQGGEAKRINDLEKILRFDQADKVIHRNNLHTHMQRVGYLSTELAQHLQDAYKLKLDPAKTHRLAKYHDDPEVITGDIPTPVKYAMKPHEKLALRQAEEEAVQQLALRYFGINYWRRKQYLEDQLEMTNKTSLEARVVNIADKMEGLCETIHEIRCGNHTFDHILDNYRNFFQTFIANEPLFEIVNADETYNLSLNIIPTVAQARKFQPIDLAVFQRNQTKFWQQVFDPHLPNFYKQWLFVSATKFDEPTLFPGWEMKETKLSTKILKDFIQ